ncbi:nuclear transport factor 2 family protein [Antarcticibacterium flavum]|uniref:Nuclear transport factor 2 family protein n=1 Tax=Antarcticibacterium flavum TaxID=2058175 RepID=A0A5B7X2H7_9FLAO|nr:MULTISPECIES: nuclear transport factor 2 family protein [Antarcticibacterium]MCM4159914.1 DUF4440 domain-containing protein [Antarcticibacterium sp. W02-3]QCY68912.1 nuclear transport factor 2 family protein [Antarcticibacterium flavum]
MKNLLLPCMMLFLSIPLVAQTAMREDEELVKKLIIDSFQDLLSEAKIDKIDTYYTRDFLLLEHGEVWTNDSINKYMNMMLKMEQMPERINTFDFIEVKIKGDMAWTAYHNKAEFKIDGRKVGEMNWLESASAIRTEDGWKLEMLHSTRKEHKEEE